MQIPRFLSLSEVISIHFDQVSDFGGTAGIRDEGLLESALAQPQATFGEQYLHSTIFAQAAAYLYHLVLNHPFIDGNKRTAFAVMDTFILLNGYKLTCSDEDAYNLVIQVATGVITKEELTDYLQVWMVEENT